MSSPPMTPPAQRERPKSSFSFRSNKSNEDTPAKTKKPKIGHVREVSGDKPRLNLASKANPNAAINEAEPGRQALEGNTMGSLRDIEHRDSEGNVIVEADLSNPTRPRFERPLDTIRSFEAAIDEKYRKSSAARSEVGTSYAGYSTRRSSSYNALDQYQQNSQRSVANGLYAPRNAPRPDYYDQSQQHYARQPMQQRYHSEPMVPQRRNFVPQPAQSFGYDQQQDAQYQGNSGHAYDPYSQHQDYNYHQHSYSYDTDPLASNGSASTDPWGNSTDPSSQNSSLDRITALDKQDTFDLFSSAPLPARDDSAQGPRTYEAAVGGRSYPQPALRPSPSANRSQSDPSLLGQYGPGPGQAYRGQPSTAQSNMSSHLPQKSSKLTKTISRDTGSSRQLDKQPSPLDFQPGIGTSPQPTAQPQQQTPPKKQSWLRRAFSGKRK